MSANPSSSPSDGSGPVMQLLASGLQLWLRQQCEAIESLEIRLEGSAMALLRGHLAGVQVLARRATYQGLQIELVELVSEPIQVQMGQVLRGRGLQLDHPFRIRGQVSFTAEGLTRSLARPQWRELGDAIAEALLGITPLTELRVQANRLVLAAQAVADRGLVERAMAVRAVNGTVEIRSLDAPPGASDPAAPGGCDSAAPGFSDPATPASAEGVLHRLPMDPNITITEASIEAGMLQLHGEARVSP